ncbi:MAG: pentose kinase [Dysgonamonadaceae bacterium]|jgi:xylulokinase|nr:pentose kinase [Dysgonamonadaceae bacterium]
MKMIAYDLGTGGIKASLFNESGISEAESFIPYNTFYPRNKWHEQRPADWWEGVCRSTKHLLEKSGASPAEIACVALSGHSLVVAPLDKKGELLTAFVPIWSDTRAGDCIEDFFSGLHYEDWYLTTGNGDPAECYSILKLMWMKKHRAELFKKVDKVLGSKDFINYKLTGVLCTDPSYASGFGVFNLRKWDYEDRFFEAAGIDKSIFPPLFPSDCIIGKITGEASAMTGLQKGTPVACGGVDNTCMALGATGLGKGKAYLSLGSSAWIAVTSDIPVLDVKTRPFVFAHARKGYYTSGVSIFSAGNSFRWIRDRLCCDLPDDETAYDRMNEMAESVPPGSRGILFNPSLAGGSAQEESPDLRGGFMGLSLSNTREDLVRASMEGVAMALRQTLDILLEKTTLEKDMLICGGGSKSLVWRKIFADVFNRNMVKTNIDQNAAALGAAALAANACGLWDGYDTINHLHRIESIERPVKERVEIYEKLLPVFHGWSAALAQLKIIQE